MGRVKKFDPNAGPPNKTSTRGANGREPNGSEPEVSRVIDKRRQELIQKLEDAGASTRGAYRTFRAL